MEKHLVPFSCIPFHHLASTALFEQYAHYQIPPIPQLLQQLLQGVLFPRAIQVQACQVQEPLPERLRNRSRSGLISSLLQQKVRNPKARKEGSWVLDSKLISHILYIWIWVNRIKKLNLRILPSQFLQRTTNTPKWFTKISLRCEVTSTRRFSGSKGKSSSNFFSAVANSASMTVLPVTIISLSTIPSLRRFFLDSSVGAKCQRASFPAITRFASSGKGSAYPMYANQLQHDQSEPYDKTSQSYSHYRSGIPLN